MQTNLVIPRVVLAAVSLIVTASLAAAASSNAETPPVEFERQQLSEHYWSEGASFGDVNRDGVPDAVSGPFWWEGPTFKKRHEFYPATATFETVNDK